MAEWPGVPRNVHMLTPRRTCSARCPYLALPTALLHPHHPAHPTHKSYSTNSRPTTQPHHCMLLPTRLHVLAHSQADAQHGITQPGQQQQQQPPPLTNNKHERRPSRPPTAIRQVAVTPSPPGPTPPPLQPTSNTLPQPTPATLPPQVRARRQPTTITTAPASQPHSPASHTPLTPATQPSPTAPAPRLPARRPSPTKPTAPPPATTTPTPLAPTIPRASSPGVPPHVPFTKYTQVQLRPSPPATTAPLQGSPRPLGTSPPLSGAVLLSAPEKLLLLLTEDGNALSTIHQALHLKTLLDQGYLTRSHLAHLYGLSPDGADDGIISQPPTTSTAHTQSATTPSTHHAAPNTTSSGSSTTHNIGTSSGACLSWSHVQAVLDNLDFKIRGKEKRCDAAVHMLMSQHSDQITQQEAKAPGVTRLQVELLISLQPKKVKTPKPPKPPKAPRKTKNTVASDDDAASPPEPSQDVEGVQGSPLDPGTSPSLAPLPPLPLMHGLSQPYVPLRPADVKKARAFLDGHSCEEIARPPLSGKKTMKVATVQSSLITVVKAGVALPPDLLRRELGLIGGPDHVSEGAVRQAIQRLQVMQKDMPETDWRFRVRDELMLVDDETQAAVQRQEDEAEDGVAFTIRQIRFIEHIMRWEQHLPPPQQQQQHTHTHTHTHTPTTSPRTHTTRRGRGNRLPGLGAA